MNITDENINPMLERYIDFTNNLSEQYNYPNNIRHLFYLIIPAFVIKYGLAYENIILKCFKETKLIISPTENKVITAYFSRTIEKSSDNNYSTKKTIVLNDYKTATLTDLMDNIIHEYNHAINSLNNEIKYDDKSLYLRTGLSYIIYDKNTLTYIKKTPDEVLEEIINTKQSEDIVNVINSFNSYNITNEEFNNALYSIKHEIKTNSYESSAYQLQTFIAKELTSNKTFFPTIESLRIKGFIEEIEAWFDNIIGIDNTYRRLIELLNEIKTAEKKYTKARFFKKRKLNQLRNKVNNVITITKDFNNKSIFK